MSTRTVPDSTSPTAPERRADPDQADGRRSGRQQRPPSPPWRTEGLPEGNEPGRPRRRSWLIWVLVAWFAFFGLTTWQDVVGAQVPTVSYNEFTAQVDAKNVKEIYAKGDTIQGTLVKAAPLPGDKNDATYTQFGTERPTFAQDDLLASLQNSNTIVRATPVAEERGVVSNLLLSMLPMLLLVAFYVWMFRRMKRSGGTGGMLGGLGGKKAKPVAPEDVRVNFSDVAGIDEVKQEVGEIVDFLQHPDKYTRLGAKAPKGVLLEGPPGTGKTLLARATAGEAQVPFFSASASEFIEMIVGVGAQRVRELFGEARKVAPSIIFIDEIDTIGRSRAGAHTMGGSDEREQTLNQILTEMDGFTGSEGVVVIAATNRADVLDPALTRAGRFDRKITVSPPDQAGREQILRVHTRGKPLAAEVDLGQVARTTPGLTGADLALLANEAALFAVKRGQSQIVTKDFADALEKIQLGSERAIVMPEEERLRTAYHEAGHALLGMLQPGADPVRKISIIPRGRALGVTLSTPETDRYGYDVDYLKGRIIGALGGMAAEQEVFGVTTTGAESDLQQVTAIARQMVGRWGMSDRIGPVQVYPADGDPRQSGASDGLLAAVDAEVRELIDECYTEARRLLRENRGKHDTLVAALMERETLDEDEAYAAVGLAGQPERKHLAGALPGSPGHRDVGHPGLG